MEKGLRPQYSWLSYNSITDEHYNSMLCERWDQVADHHFNKEKLQNHIQCSTGLNMVHPMHHKWFTLLFH
jgi:hypothetical protein